MHALWCKRLYNNELTRKPDTHKNMTLVDNESIQNEQELIPSDVKEGSNSSKVDHMISIMREAGSPVSCGYIFSKATEMGISLKKPTIQSYLSSDKRFKHVGSGRSGNWVLSDNKEDEPLKNNKDKSVLKDVSSINGSSDEETDWEKIAFQKLNKFLLSQPATIRDFMKEQMMKFLAPMVKQQNKNHHEIVTNINGFNKSEENTIAEQMGMIIMVLDPHNRGIDAHANYLLKMDHSYFFNLVPEMDKSKFSECASVLMKMSESWKS